MSETKPQSIEQLSSLTAMRMLTGDKTDYAKYLREFGQVCFASGLAAGRGGGGEAGSSKGEPMSDNLKHPCHTKEAAGGLPYRCPHCGATVSAQNGDDTVDAQYVLDHAGEYEMVGLVPCAWTYKSDGKGSVRCGKNHSNEWTGLIESILKMRFRPVPSPAVIRTSFDDKRDGIPDSGLVVITLNDKDGKVMGYSTVWKDGPNGYPALVSWGRHTFARSSVSSDQYIERPALETRVLTRVCSTELDALSGGGAA